ncbi:MAG TPA: sulfite exporter TauE/SafE family protein [Solirubrobacterales bacterium]
MLELLAVAAAGAAAGASNAIAGAGSLITFPTLVALGVPALSANVTSTVGLIPGAVGGAYGYLDLLTDRRDRLFRLAIPSLAGAIVGTALLLITANSTFEVIVPFLVAGSCLLLLFQPRLTARISQAGNEHSPLLTVGLLFAGAYAAYFGSAVGILLLGLLGLFVADSMQRLNGMKIVLAGLANLLAAIAYAFLATVDWRYAIALMISSLIGGQLGARLARRISGDTLRVAIAIVGLVVAGVLAWRVFA